jgi:DNA-binding phage protein
MVSKPSRPHGAATIESFRNDPAFAADYLNAVLEDGDEAELLQALHWIAEAFRGTGEGA